MLTARVIARIDIKPSLGAVKGVRLDGLRRIGPAAELAVAYEDQGADELLLIDTTASLYVRPPAWDIIREVAHLVTIPVTYCGGIRSVQDALHAMRIGCEKVGINTAAVERPELLAELVPRVGAQAVAVSLEAKRRSAGWVAYKHGGRERTERNAIEWAHEAMALGVGELIATSVDQDGTQDGYDLELMCALREELPDSVIVASGGCYGPDDVAMVLEWADAAAVGSWLHEGGNVAEIKAALSAMGVEVR